MKTVSYQQFQDVSEDILADLETKAKAEKKEFDGVSREDYIAELNKRLGTDWVLKEDEPFKFSKDDINAIANSRFYKKVGLKILLLWAVVILVLLQLVSWFPAIPIYVYWIGCALATMGFIYWYNKRQKEFRQEMWKGIRGDGIESED